MEIPFVGGAYEQRSLSINAQRSINCFPVVDKQDAKNVVAMYGTPGLKFFAMATLYGSGADGVVTISADTTLTGDKQYTTLTVNAGITLNTAGFTVMCDTLLTNNGIITDSSSGGAGGTGGTGYGNAGTYGQEAIKPGAGDGGDGGYGGGTVGVGGNGGKGGGIVRIFAKTLTNNGTIHANGTAATAPTSSGSGADGGDGGTVILYYDARTVGTVTATAGAASSYVADNIDEDFSDISDWTDSDTVYTESSISPAGQVKFDTKDTVTRGYTTGCSGRSRVYTALPSKFTIDMKAYFDAIGTSLDSFNLYMYTGNSPLAFNASFQTDGMFIYGNSLSNEVGTNIVKCNGSAAWQEYRIRVDNSNPAEAYAAVYVREGSGDWELKGSVRTDNTSNVGTTPRMWLRQYGCITDSRITHLDYFKLSSGVVIDDGTAGSAGTASWVNLPYTVFSSAVFRGALVNGTTLYAVVGANILSIATTGVATVLGTITTTTGNVFMASNGTQVLIVDGTTAGHFITIATGAVTDVTLPGEASSCAFCDGYFVITHASTQETFISGLYDATSWDAADHEYVEGSPDNLLRVMHCNHMLWFFGVSTIEVFYNSGAADFPFARISGALIDKGLGATASAVLIDNQFYFLSDKFEVLRTVGYQFEKVSTIHVETEIQGYATKSDAIGYEYRIDGHVFYVVTFPTADHTWVFDTTTGFWHEWQSYKTQGTATFGRHRGSIGFFFNDKYMVGDHTNGKIYELDMTTYTDDGEYIKRTRRAQYINKDRKRVAHFEIDLEFESGVGLGGASDPQVGLTWSDDSGNTWATVQYRDLGELADYKARQRWLRLGMARSRIYELTMYEPVKFVLVGSSANIEGEAS